MSKFSGNSKFGNLFGNWKLPNCLKNQNQSIFSKFKITEFFKNSNNQIFWQFKMTKFGISFGN